MLPSHWDDGEEAKWGPLCLPQAPGERSYLIVPLVWGKSIGE